MYHQPAGISKYTWKLANALSRIDRENEYLIFQHRKHVEPLIDQSNFRRVTLYTPTHRRFEQTALALELRRHDLDLLHSTDFIPPVRSPIPSVITVHDLGFLHWPHFLTKDSAAYYGQIDRAVRHAKHIIVPSQHTKKDLIGLLGVPNDQISVIYEAADGRYQPLPLAETRRVVRRKFNLPERFILFVGTVEPRKNIVGLLRAYHHLRTRYNITDTALVLAGKQGWLYDEIGEEVEKLDLASSVIFTGRVSDEELHQLYVAAHVHVHPAVYEGFGLPPLEAMACGTPTVVSNTSSLPEVVGDAGLLVDPDDYEELAVAVHRLLTNPELHAEMREKGLKRAQCFRWHTAALQTLEIYRRVHAEATQTTAMPPLATANSTKSAN
jgi:glycosyltransferase involved in cell wall biosynthesis